MCRQTITVQPSDIVITSVMDSPEGLRIQFYVRGMTGGVINQNDVVEALRVSYPVTVRRRNGNALALNYTAVVDHVGTMVSLPTRGLGETIKKHILATRSLL